MNKKIKLYAIVLTAVYVCVIISSLIEAVDPFFAGFKAGYTERKTTRNFVRHITVEPIEKGSYSFSVPVSIGNQVATPTIELDKLRVEHDLLFADFSTPYLIYYVVAMLLSFVVFGALLYIPFLFFTAINLIRKGQMYDPKVLRRLRRIGWIVIAYFLMNVYYEVGETFFNKQFIQIDSYQIVYPMPNFMPLILGLVILFLVEVLRIGLFMKEEQDLTI